MIRFTLAPEVKFLPFAELSHFSIKPSSKPKERRVGETVGCMSYERLSILKRIHNLVFLQVSFYFKQNSHISLNNATNV